MSDLFIDRAGVVCNVQARSMNFGITDYIHGKKHLNYFRFDCSNNPSKGFFVTPTHMIDLQQLKTKINEDHSLLIIKESPVVEVKETEVKKVIEQLETLMFRKFIYCELLFESNGIWLIDEKNNHIIKSKVGLFDIKHLEEILNYPIPMSPMEIIHIDHNENVILEELEEKEEDVKKEKEEEKKEEDTNLEEENWISI